MPQCHVAYGRPYSANPVQAYLELAKNVDQAVQFMNAAGLQSSSPIMAETEFYVSHEALLLDYEQALTRLDSTTGRWCVPMQRHSMRLPSAWLQWQASRWPVTAR